jgi:hypothetical protein
MMGFSGFCTSTILISVKSDNMNTQGNNKGKAFLLAKIWGIIVTSFMLLAIGSKIIISVTEDIREYINELSEAFSNPLDPTLYFFIYITGYIILWWKPIIGSIMIIIASIYYVSVAGFGGPPIFAAPGFLVGVLYLGAWYVQRRNQSRGI